jgi:hypothetical protein
MGRVGLQKLIITITVVIAVLLVLIAAIGFAVWRSRQRNKQASPVKEQQHNK